MQHNQKGHAPEEVLGQYGHNLLEAINSFSEERGLCFSCLFEAITFHFSCSFIASGADPEQLKLFFASVVESSQEAVEKSKLARH